MTDYLVCQEHCSNLWETSIKLARGISDLDEPVLLNCNYRNNYNTLTVLEGVVSNIHAVHPTTAEDHYRVNHYFPALESIISGLSMSKNNKLVKQ